MGHTAVRQAAVAAANVLAEAEGHTPGATYDHELMLAIDKEDCIYLHDQEPQSGMARVKQDCLWGWVKGSGANGEEC